MLSGVHRTARQLCCWAGLMVSVEINRTTIRDITTESSSSSATRSITRRHDALAVFLLVVRALASTARKDGRKVALSPPSHRTPVVLTRRPCVLSRPPLCTGCANKKNNPLRKIHYLTYCKRFFHQIYSFHRGGLAPHMQQISSQYLRWFINYNYLNLKVQFSK